MKDNLAEFNGIKPNFILAEREERVVKSKIDGLTYKVKRNAEHFYCTCPAWRNQTGTPVNARSCKHLSSLLGVQYEEARLEHMNPGGPPPKGLPVRRPTKAQNSQSEPVSVPSHQTQTHMKPAPVTTVSSSSKSPISGLLKVIEDKAQAKRKESVKEKIKEDDEDMDVDDANGGVNDDAMDEDENEDPNQDAGTDKADEKPKSRQLKTESVASTIAKRTLTKRKRVEYSSEEEDAVHPPTKATAVRSSSHTKRKSSTIRPVKRKKDETDTETDHNEEEEEDEVQSKKHTNQKPKGQSSANKSSKRKDAISETEDDSDAEEKKKSSAKGKGKSEQKPLSKAKVPAKTLTKPSSKKRARKDVQSESEDEDEPGNDSEDQSNAMESSSSKGKPFSKRQKIEEEEDDEDDDKGQDDKDGDNDDSNADGDDAHDSDDELASIKGVKPNVLMKDGEEKEVQSQTSSSTYKVKRTWDHYYCTCPAWRNQPSVPVNARSCKHLIALLGEKYEAARIKLKNPDGTPFQAPNSKKKSSGSKKGKKSGDPDGDGASDKADVAVLLANSWDIDKGPDPTGWWISEKLDGVRTFYDGKRMYSRLGNPFTPPQWFLDKLPKDVTLDGELFGGRGEFQNTVSIVKTMNSPHWKGITFHIFDIPSLSTQPFEARMERLKKLFAPDTGSHASDKVVVVEQEKAKSRQHVLDKLKEVESLGGEGLMLRKPGSLYEGKRSSTLLKIKSFYDAEAVVTGYKSGKGRNAGVTGALKCKMASGKTFDVGSGLNDKQRKNPPKIGSIIVYRFQELTKDGVPRFPTFLGEAADKTQPKDAVVPDHRKAGAKKSDA